MGCSESSEVKHPPAPKPVAPAKPAEAPKVDPNAAAHQQMMMQQQQAMMMQ